MTADNEALNTLLTTSFMDNERKIVLGWLPTNVAWSRKSMLDTDRCCYKNFHVISKARNTNKQRRFTHRETYPGKQFKQQGTLRFQNFSGTGKSVVKIRPALCFQKLKVLKSVIGVVLPGHVSRVTHPAVIVCVFYPLRSEFFGCVAVYWVTYVWFCTNKYCHHNQYTCKHKIQTT